MMPAILSSVSGNGQFVLSGFGLYHCYIKSLPTGKTALKAVLVPVGIVCYLRMTFATVTVPLLIVIAGDPPTEVIVVHPVGGPLKSSS
jgi:hypothetical protein